MNFRKTVCIGLLALVLGTSVYAAETDTTKTQDIITTPGVQATTVPISESNAKTANTLDIIMEVEDVKNLEESDAVFELYDLDGKFLVSQTVRVDKNVKEIKLHFDLPEFEVGTDFRLKLAGGLKNLQYYDDYIAPGGYFDVDTYELEDGTACTTVYMSAYPKSGRYASLFRDGSKLELEHEPIVIDGVTMVPVMEVAPAIGISRVKYNEEWNSITLTVGKKQMIFNVGAAYTTVFGEDTYIPVATQKIDGTYYVPLRSLCTPFESDIAVEDKGDHFEINLSKSKIAEAYEKEQNENNINIFVDYNLMDLEHKAKKIDGHVMIPVMELAPKVNVNDVKYFSEWNSIRIAAGKYELLFNVGSAYTTVFGKDTYTNVPAQEIDGVYYVQLSTFAEAFECEIWQSDEGTHLDINLGKSQLVVKVANENEPTTKEQRINGSGVGSRTNYLIWINKSDYKLRVYTRTNSSSPWVYNRGYTVAIGAPGTETPTGQWDYYEKCTYSWDYPTFTVKPIMRFNGGYAIHSTLLNYDGTNYDSRVGMMLSHGCIRVQPDGIRWLYNNIPLYTKVYITAS